MKITPTRRLRRGPIATLLAFVVFVLWGAVPAGAAQTQPWVTFWTVTANVSGANPYIVMAGDSHTVAKDYTVTGGANYLKSQSGRATFVSGTPGGSWMTYAWPGQQNGNSLLQDLAAFFRPGTTVAALGTNDARIMTKSPASYSQQQQLSVMQQAVSQTRRSSSCVLLVNVRERETFEHSALNAARVNANMRTVASTNTRVFIADWNSHSKSRPEWFRWDSPSGTGKPDVHFTDAGSLNYWAFIAQNVNWIRLIHGC